jgi:hypothetical protein
MRGLMMIAVVFSIIGFLVYTHHTKRTEGNIIATNICEEHGLKTKFYTTKHSTLRLCVDPKTSLVYDLNTLQSNTNDR